MANLFNIAEEYLRLVSELEESGGELSEELEARLNINREELENKIKAYYHIIKLNDAQVRVSKDEKQRLNDRQKTKENLIARLEKAVSFAIDMFGEVKPKAKTKSLSFDTLNVWNKETESLIIEDVALIPKKYLTRSVIIPYNDVLKVEEFLITNNISYQFAENVIVNNAVIKNELLLNKDRSDEDKVIIPGVKLQTNVTPVFR